MSRVLKQFFRWTGVPDHLPNRRMTETALSDPRHYPPRGADSVRRNQCSGGDQSTSWVPRVAMCVTLTAVIGGDLIDLGSLPHNRRPWKLVALWQHGNRAPPPLWRTCRSWNETRECLRLRSDCGFAASRFRVCRSRTGTLMRPMSSIAIAIGMACRQALGRLQESVALGEHFCY